MNTNTNRRDFLKHLSIAAASLAIPGCSNIANTHSQRPPNFIIIFCDDLGYGDLGCFGSKKHRTPHIDQMAKEGTRFTSFYVTSGVCTPSRSSLMTGCYPRRVNMHQNSQNQWVLFPVGKKGLNPNEITIAEVLKKKNYATACIGKWHLGDQPKYLPTRQGFDFYYGIPYSNDMGSNQRKTNPPLPLLRNETVIEAPVNQNTITQRYTHEALKFIKSNKDNPFLLYLPHTMPHNPVHELPRQKRQQRIRGHRRRNRLLHRPNPQYPQRPRHRPPNPRNLHLRQRRRQKMGRQQPPPLRLEGKHRRGRHAHALHHALAGQNPRRQILQPVILHHGRDCGAWCEGDRGGRDCLCWI